MIYEAGKICPLILMSFKQMMSQLIQKNIQCQQVEFEVNKKIPTISDQYEKRVTTGRLTPKSFDPQ